MRCGAGLSLVARGNVESIPTLSLGTAEESLFSEIKTGGNGEPIRITAW